MRYYVSKISLIIFGVFSSVCGVMVSFCSQQFIKLEYRKIVLHCIYVECFNGHKIGKCYLIRKKSKIMHFGFNNKEVGYVLGNQRLSVVNEEGFRGVS